MENCPKHFGHHCNIPNLPYLLEYLHHGYCGQTWGKFKGFSGNLKLEITHLFLFKTCFYSHIYTCIIFFSYQEVVDFSDGCGAKFSVVIVSDKFEGKPLLAQHRMVNDCLAEELKTIHALTIKTIKPAQWDKQKAT